MQDRLCILFAKSRIVPRFYWIKILRSVLNYDKSVVHERKTLSTFPGVSLAAQTQKINTCVLFSLNICVPKVKISNLNKFYTFLLHVPHFSASSSTTRSSKKEVEQEVTIIISVQRSNTDYACVHVCCAWIRSFNKIEIMWYLLYNLLIFKW